MKDTEKNRFFWDACVFIRFLVGDRSADCYGDIVQHLEDAKAGKTVIYYSTISIVEVRPTFLGDAGYGSFDDFLADFEGAFAPVEPTPDILRWCAVAHDIKYPDPNGGKDRVLTTPDAIQLLSAVWAKEVGKMPDLIFHTLDGGKGRTVESKHQRTVSLLEFEKFVDGIPANPYTPKICQLVRSKPHHPSPKLAV